MIKLYIDPGSGSLFFQALISIGITGLLFFKRIYNYFKFMFGSGKKDQDDEDL